MCDRCTDGLQQTDGISRLYPKLLQLLGRRETNLKRQYTSRMQTVNTERRRHAMSAQSPRRSASTMRT